MKATSTSSVTIKKAISKHLSIISEHVLVILTDIATHLVSLVTTAHSTVKIKKGISKTFKATVINVASLFKKIPRTIKATSTSSVRIIKAIAKTIKATVTETVTLVKHSLYYRFFYITSNTSTKVIRTITKSLGYVATNVTTLIRSTNKVLKAVSISLTKLFHEFVLIYGAVPLYTFIVPSKKLKIKIVKVLTLIMTKGKK